MATKAEKLLRAAIKEGLTFGEAVAAFAKKQTAREKALGTAAREHFSREGELEFDTYAGGAGPIVSDGGDDGAYVMGWQWVPDELIPKRHRNSKET